MTWRHLIIVVMCWLGSPALAFESHSFTLENGMQVILIPNTKVPVVYHSVWYRAGAIDEREGKTGLAHFLEHLMFKGTPNFSKGQFSSLIAAVGGDDNAFTSPDCTAYHQTIAKDQLALVMQLEADRMQHLTFDPDEIEKEREVIIEERRARVDNQPASLFAERMKTSLYLNHPYRNPLIGWAKDMATLTLEDAKQWYQTYYAPNNAILVVSGDVTLEELMPLAQKYYGAIPRKIIPPRKWPKEPVHHEARRISMEDERVATDELYRYYLAPSQGEGKQKQGYALTVLSYWLGAGQTSQLYEQLVLENQVAAGASSSYDDLSLGPAIFALHVTMKEGQSPDKAEKLLDRVLARAKDQPMTQAELTRTKNALLAQAIYAQEDMSDLGYIYGQVLATGLKPDYIESWQDQIAHVTAKQVQEAAKAIFNEKASVTGYLTAPRTVVQKGKTE